MFVAELSDPAHGRSEATGKTEEEAVEAAFRILAASWTHPADMERWPVDSPMFDGYIDDRGRVWWWDGEVLLGTVATNGGGVGTHDFLSGKLGIVLPKVLG